MKITREITLSYDIINSHDLSNLVSVYNTRKKMKERNVVPLVTGLKPEYCYSQILSFLVTALKPEYCYSQILSFLQKRVSWQPHQASTENSLGGSEEPSREKPPEIEMTDMEASQSSVAPADVQEGDWERRLSSQNDTNCKVWTMVNESSEEEDQEVRETPFTLHSTLMKCHVDHYWDFKR